VVCDDPFREGVVEMLSLAGDIEVAAEAATLAVVSEYGPDVMLLDLEMSDGMGADEPIGCIQALPLPPRVDLHHARRAWDAGSMEKAM
jgi:DNA-binding NarL/FixJ family response regulator